MRARSAALGCVLLLGACAAPRAVDPCQRTLDGFRASSPQVAELLDRAEAWAVFPATEDRGDACEHPGALYGRGGESAESRLACAWPDVAPGGLVQHVLVVLLDPDDLQALEHGPLALEDAVERTLEDLAETPPLDTSRWVITTRTRGLFFETPVPTRVLSLAPTGP